MRISMQEVTGIHHAAADGSRVDFEVWSADGEASVSLTCRDHRLAHVIAAALAKINEQYYEIIPEDEPPF